MLHLKNTELRFSCLEPENFLLLSPVKCKLHKNQKVTYIKEISKWNSKTAKRKRY